MKIKHILPMAVIPLLVSCINDESTYGTDSISLTIGGIEYIYNIVSYSDDHLRITPTINSSFSEDDLQYEWSYANTATTASSSTDTIRPTVICQEKDLDYQSRLEDGTYNFFFKVTSKGTGYSQTSKATVYAASALSKGFYALKETADGNSDVDLYNTTQNKVFNDVMTNYQGAPVKGKPQHLDIVGNMSYLDSIKGKPAADNLLSIVTDYDGGDVKWIRTRDAKTVKCFDDCHYEKIEGEVPYRTVRVGSIEFFMTSNGVYTTQVNYGTGVFGAYQYDTEGSSHIASTRRGGIIYWYPTKHALRMVDANGYSASVLSTLESPENQHYRPNYCNEYECMYIGENTMNYKARITAVMQSNATASTQERVLFNLSDSYSTTILDAVRVLDANSHMAKATKYALCERKARVLYGLENNKVYSLSLNDNSSVEEELIFENLPSSETITYIANKYEESGSTTFDYIVVGTQSSDSYHLYFYTNLGGKPDGKPVFEFTGTGRFVNVEYTDPMLKSLVGCGIMDD